MMVPQMSPQATVTIALLVIIFNSVRGDDAFVAEVPGNFPRTSPMEMNNAWFNIGFPKMWNQHEDNINQANNWFKWKRSVSVPDFKNENTEVPIINPTSGLFLNWPPFMQTESEPVFKYLDAIKLKAKMITENKNSVDGTNDGNGVSTIDGNGSKPGIGGENNPVKEERARIDIRDVVSAISSSSVVNEQDDTGTIAANNGKNVIVVEDDGVFVIADGISNDGSNPIANDHGATFIDDDGAIINDRKEFLVKDGNIYSDVYGPYIIDGINLNDGEIVNDDSIFSDGEIGPDNTFISSSVILPNIESDFQYAPSYEAVPEFSYNQPVTFNSLRNITVHLESPTDYQESFFRRFVNLFTPFRNEKPEKNSEKQDKIGQLLQYQYVITISIYMLGWIFVILSIIGIITYLRRVPRDCLNEGPHEIGYI